MTEPETNICTFWDNSACEGTPYCQPRCPRFVDEEGLPLLVKRYDPTHREGLSGMYRDLDTYDKTLGLPPQGKKLED